MIDWENIQTTADLERALEKQAAHVRQARHRALAHLERALRYAGCSATEAHALAFGADDPHAPVLAEEPRPGP